jgi:hypothetical protein
MSVMIKIVLSVLVLASSLLAGLVITKLTPEELVVGRKYFRVASFVSVLIIVFSLNSWYFGIIDSSLASSVSLTSAYLLVICIMSQVSGKNLKT